MVLPRGATGVRSWRRERLRRQRRQRRLAAAVLFLAVLGAAVLVGMESPAGERTSTTVAAPAPVPPVGPLPTLLVVTDNSANVVDLAVLIPLLSGKGGSIVAMPTETVTEIVPGGAQPISAALVSTPNAPGDEKMISSVENMLGISVPSIAVVDFTQLSTMLEPTGGLHVDLPDSIIPNPDTEGNTFYAGPNLVSASEVGSFLSDQSAAGTTEQVQRFGLLVQAWADALRSDPQAAPSSASTAVGAGALGKTLTALSRGAAVVAPLPLQEIPAESPGAPIEYQLNSAQYLQMLPSLDPGQPGALEPRPKVQLLNGTGGLGLDEEAMVKLEPWVQVTLSGNACTPQGSQAQISCFGYATTKIITYDSRGREAAQRVRQLLGTGEILRSTGSSDIVDMTVIVGADFHVSG